MKVQKFGILMMALALVAAMGTSSANAAVVYSNGGSSITLAELLAGGSITVDTAFGTAEFKNWGGFGAIATGGALVVDPNEITVTGIEGEKVGVHYQSAVLFADIDQTQDTEWSYEVDLNGGASDTMDLEIMGFSAQGSGRLTVFENAKAGTEDVADTFVIDSASQTQSFNWAMFDQPRDWFTIFKDVALVGGDSGAGFSGMDQTFNVIPEPATFGLLGLGALGLIRRRRTA